MPVATPPRYRPRSHNIHPFSPEAMSGFAAVGGNAGSWASATYPSANLALFYPFVLTEPATAVQLWAYNGATASGNLDLGIYNAAGAKLVSKGSTAQAGTNDLQRLDITDTVLPSGQVLYMAIAFDGTVGTLFRLPANTATTQLRALGMFEMAAAFPLPATATFAVVSTANFIPCMGVSFMGTH